MLRTGSRMRSALPGRGSDPLAVGPTISPARARTIRRPRGGILALLGMVAAGMMGMTGVDEALAGGGGGQNQRPSCTITAPTGNVTIDAGQSVAFNGTGSDPDNNLPLTYSWSFPGGTPASSTAANAGNVTFGTAGSYNVTFTVTDSKGAACSPVASRTVTVNAGGGGDPHATLSPTDLNANGYLDTKDVTKACLSCHTDQAKNMFHSVHYQWTGPNTMVTNLGAGVSSGKDVAALNSYCGSIDTSPWFTCLNCHSGNGGTIDHTVAFGANPPQTQLENIDCMMCHQESYVRTGRTEGPDPFMTYAPIAPRPDGVTSLEIPYFDQPFIFTPNLTAMGGTAGLETAMRTVHPTTRKTCLRCHAGAAGRDGAKRGDMWSGTGSTTLQPASDVHMAPTATGGKGLACSSCHSAKDAQGNATLHRVRGRGVDLRPSERDLSGNVLPRLTCDNAGCHTSQPHGDYSDIDGRDRHAGRVACQSCHIPKFAKDWLTEMGRNWKHPEFSATACSGRGGWVPSENKQQNVTPVYGWFDGTSKIYQLGTKPADVSGLVATDQGPYDPAPKTYYRLALANGAVNSQSPSPIAKLHPMKFHTGLGALLTSGPAAGQLVAPSTFIYFIQAGDQLDVGWDKMVKEGMKEQFGVDTYSYSTVDAMEYQTINHGVSPATNALVCGNCHAGYKGYTPVMDLKGKLGYGLRTQNSIITGQPLDGTVNTVCTQCHTLRSVKSFEGQHSGHVGNRQFDCSACHNFARPEQGLKTSL
jgi:Cytochrome c bacterial/PKD domain